MLAAVLVLVGLYSLLQSPSSPTVQATGSDGSVTAASKAQASRAHASKARADEDDDEDEDENEGGEADEEDEGRATGDGAAARARARAEGIAATESAAATASAAPATPAAPVAPAPAATGAAAASTAGPAPANVAAAGAVPPPIVRTGGTGALSWAPPAGWTGYPVTKVSSAGSLNTVDGRGGDVTIKLDPTHAVGPVVIKNCRNAVLIGGRIDVLPTAKVDGQDQRAVYVKDCTGVVHIEGLQINGAVAGSESDGFAVKAPKAIVQIQNVRVEGMRGGKSGNHADVFQPWGGVREYRIDRLTGSTNYQGLHVGVDLGPIGGGTITNTNISSSGVGPADSGGQFIWLDCNAYPLTLDNVYIAGRSGRSFGSSIWPQTGSSGCGATVSGGLASWPGYTSLRGGVRDGRPASGDFVPAGSVGLGYSSPGYR
jgi:hypothetical protein